MKGQPFRGFDSHPLRQTATRPAPDWRGPNPIPRGDMRMLHTSAALLIAGLLTFLSPVFAKDVPANRQCGRAVHYFTSEGLGRSSLYVAGSGLFPEILAEDFLRNIPPREPGMKKPSGELGLRPHNATVCRLPFGSGADVRLILALTLRSCTGLNLKRSRCRTESTRGVVWYGPIHGSAVRESGKSLQFRTIALIARRSEVTVMGARTVN